MAASDVTATITEFLADQSRNSMQLPSMTAKQRKETKSLVEQYSELRCESYGFGVDRQLHLFKTHGCDEPQRTTQASIEKDTFPTHAVHVKNTFIDDWASTEPEPMIFRSLQVPLNKGDLYLHSKASQRDRSFDCSTASGEESVDSRSNDMDDSSSVRGRPDQEASSVLDVQFGKVAQVRNTFIQFEAISMDERIVQSMPHGMFGRCLSAGNEIQPSACEQEASKGTEVGLGALVVIQGLVKAPAFNGHQAMVQGWDEVSQRYSVMITSSAYPQQAKVKAENLQLIAYSR